MLLFLFATQAPDNINPTSLSLRDSRLLVTDGEHARLTLYDSDGRLLETIVLVVPDLEQHLNQQYDEEENEESQTWYPLDASETARSTIVVCFADRTRVLYQVCELDMTGNPLAWFKANDPKYGLDPANLDWPSDVTLDAMGRVLVADRNNRRVLLLDRSLEFSRVLLKANCDPEVDGGPRSVRLGPEDGQLIVCLSNGVGVFGV